MCMSCGKERATCAALADQYIERAFLVVDEQGRAYDNKNGEFAQDLSERQGSMQGNWLDVALYLAQGVQESVRAFDESFDPNQAINWSLLKTPQHAGLVQGTLFGSTGKFEVIEDARDLGMYRFVVRVGSHIDGGFYVALLQRAY